MALASNTDRSLTRPPVDLLVSNDGASRTFVHLRSPNRAAEMGLLQAVSPEMAHVTFHTLTAPAYSLGSDVELVFPLGEKSTVFSSVVWSRAERQDERDYVLRFVVTPAEKELLTQAILRICDQRKRARVAPDKKTCSLLVRARPEDPWVECDLKDISRGGLGVLCLAVIEPEGLARADSLEVQLKLPTHSAPLFVVGRIVNRELFSGTVRYGVKFDQAKCPNFEESVKRILEYVTLRQEEALMERARNSSTTTRLLAPIIDQR